MGYCLPFVQRIINSATHSSIGVSPAELLFGNAIQLDRGIILTKGELPEVEETQISDRAARMIDAQAKIILASQEYQQSLDVGHVLKRHKNTELTEYSINEYVLVGYPQSNLKPGPPDKLMTNLAGPMRVVNRIGDKY